MEFAEIDTRRNEYNKFGHINAIRSLSLCRIVVSTFRRPDSISATFVIGRVSSGFRRKIPDRGQRGRRAAKIPVKVDQAEGKRGTFRLQTGGA